MVVVIFRQDEKESRIATIRGVTPRRVLSFNSLFKIMNLFVSTGSRWTDWFNWIRNFRSACTKVLGHYAICMFSHQSLCSVGVLYLDLWPTVGSTTLEHLLTRLPCQSENKGTLIIALAERRKLTAVATSVCRVMGRRSLQLLGLLKLTMLRLLLMHQVKQYEIDNFL